MDRSEDVAAGDILALEGGDDAGGGRRGLIGAARHGGNECAKQQQGDRGSAEPGGGEEAFRQGPSHDVENLSRIILSTGSARRPPGHVIQLPA